MRSGDLHAFLSLNSPSYGLVLSSICSFVQNQPENTIFQKFNISVKDGRTDGRTNGQTHPLTEMRERT